MNTKPASPSRILSRSFDSTKVQKKPINLKRLGLDNNTSSKLAFLLENVLTSQECKLLIEISERKGYRQATVNMGGGREVLDKSIRSNSRTVIDDDEFAQILWRRIRCFIPSTFKWNTAIGVNERLRFLRYDPGDKFKMHQDGTFVRALGMEKSMITLQIYLNQGFEGGETTFIGTNKRNNILIVPEEGTILVFQHDITHEGSEVKSGRKYTIRTEVMYRSWLRDVQFWLFVIFVLIALISWVMGVPWVTWK